MHGAISTQAAADGSSYLEMGNTKVICTVIGPSEVRNQGMASRDRHDDRAGVSVNISVAGFSGIERKRRTGDKRISEMQSTLQTTFQNSLFLDRYPRSTIQIWINVLGQDGSMLAACLNAATLALIDAGIPMMDYVCACTAGSTANTLSYTGGAGDDESTDPLLDLNSQEELELPFLTVGSIGASDKVVCLVMETRVRIDRVESMLAVAVDGCKQVKEVLDGIVRRHGKALLANSVG